MSRFYLFLPLTVAASGLDQISWLRKEEPPYGMGKEIHFLPFFVWGWGEGVTNGFSQTRPNSQKNSRVEWAGEPKICTCPPTLPFTLTSPTITPHQSLQMVCFFFWGGEPSYSLGGLWGIPTNIPSKIAPYTLSLTQFPTPKDPSLGIEYRDLK